MEGGFSQIQSHINILLQLHALGSFSPSVLQLLASSNVCKLYQPFMVVLHNHIVVHLRVYRFQFELSLNVYSYCYGNLSCCCVRGNWLLSNSFTISFSQILLCFLKLYIGCTKCCKSVLWRMLYYLSLELYPSIYILYVICFLENQLSCHL